MPVTVDSYTSAMAFAFDSKVREVASVIASHTGEVYEHGATQRKRAEVVAVMSEHLRRAYAEWDNGNYRDALRQLEWAIQKGDDF